MKRKDNVFKVAGVYASVIIGAGFASGQELMKFFVDYGQAGVIGLLISGALFSLVGWAVLEMCHENGFGYQELIQHCMGKNLGLVTEVAAAFFMYVLYVTMIAGTGATLNQVFDLEFSVGAAAGALVCFIAMMFDLEGLMEINSKLAPVLAAGGILIGLFAFARQSAPAMAIEGSPRWLFSSLTYTSYNIVTSISVLAAMGKTISSKKTCRRAALLGGGLMTVLGLCMLYPLYLYYSYAAPAEVPLLLIANRFGLAFEYFYFITLMCAIFTTAISNGFALSAWAGNRLGINPLAAKAFLALSAFAVSHIGFSMFVSKVYPVFSLIGTIEIAAIFIAWKRGKKKALDMPEAA
ncbi:MAG: hypothetical protein LBU32_06700 [Clostridiales bacterium]|jgi:uncharacterized membrane protein YkvI|nr:hypothetical protein [Clostridiales bacterium]